MIIIPHLKFRGNCREALSFYKECFGGDIKFLQTFGEQEEFAKRLPVEFHKNVMHAEFVSGDLHFFACDAVPMHQHHGCCNSDMQDDEDYGCCSSGMAKDDNRIDLGVSFASESEQTQVFDLLSRGGIVEMPLQDTFWGDRFGIVCDKYGFKWPLNFDKKRSS
jgi:PhnB protein